jgi:hypothetical protein
VTIFLPDSQPATQPASHPASQPPDRLSYNRPYLGNQWADLTQILNFRLHDQT